MILTKLKKTYTTELIFIYAILILLLLRLWNNPIISTDDFYAYTAKFKDGGIFQASLEIAKFQGRISHIIYYPLFQICYLSDSLDIVNCFRILSNLFVILCFWYFLIQYFSFRKSICIVLIYLVLSDTVGDRFSFNPFFAYPFVFNFGLGLLFLSFSFYIRSLKNNSSIILSSILFFLSLFSYEIILLFSIIFIYLFYKFRTNRTIKVFKTNIPLIIFVVLYLLIYFIWRIEYPPKWEGVKGLSWGGLKTISTIFKYSVNGFYIPFHTNDYRFLKRINFEALFIALISTYLLFFKLKLVINKVSHPFFSFLLSGLFIFLPNILFGFTERYRNWWADYYIGSFYSAFFISIFIYILFSFFNNLSFKISIYLRIFFSFLFFLIVYINQSQSIYFYSNKKKDKLKWDAIDLLCNDLKNYDSVNNKVIYTNTIISKTEPDPYNYWNYYISSKSNKNIKIIYSDYPDTSANNIYYNNSRLILKTSDRIFEVKKNP